MIITESRYQIFNYCYLLLPYRLCMSIKRLWFLTENQGKLSEAERLFSTIGIEVCPLMVRGEVPEVIEPQSESLEMVSRAKLEQGMQIMHHLGIEEEHLFVEDSGLFIDKLNGFPGVFSSYVLKKIGTHGILKLMQDYLYDDETLLQSYRRAEFRAVATLWNGHEIIQTLGTCPGFISLHSIEGEGFGFDPIFVPFDLDENGNPLDAGESGQTSTKGTSFGEVSQELKGKFSHRNRALKQLFRYFK